jgi:hypothetical protein
VHLLSLASGLTVCVDLHDPFGTKPEPLVDTIGWADGDTVAIAHGRPSDEGSRVAAFSATAIWDGPVASHYHADLRTDVAGTTIPSEVGGVPGFRRFIAVARDDS